MKDKYKYLNRFSKEILITWITEQEYYTPPKESDLLWIVWYQGTKQLAQDNKYYSSKFAYLLSSATKYNEYVKVFNNAPDAGSKLDLLEKMQAHVNLSMKYRLDRKALDDRQKKYDTIYEEIQDLKKQGR